MDKNDAFRILFKKMINIEARNAKLEDEVAALRSTLNLDEKSREHSHYLQEVVQKLMKDYPQLINVEELNNIFGLSND